MSANDALRDLTQLLSTHTDSSGRQTFPFVFRSRLKKWAGNQTVNTGKGMKASQVEEAKKFWRQCVTQGDFSELTQRTVRILSSDSSSVKSTEFARYVNDRAQRLSPRVVRTLLPTLHQEWNENPAAHKVMIAAVRSWIDAYKGKDQVLLNWQMNIERLAGSAAPSLIGREVAFSLEEAGVILERFKLKTGMTKFAMLANDHAIVELSKTITSAALPSNDRWSFLLEKLLKTNLASRAAKVNALSYLIQTLRQADASRWHQPREDLKTFILTSKDFGDPRIHPERWYQFPREAVEALVAWLSEEDIEFFFKLIIRDDPHGRRDYWLQFVPHVRASRVAVSKSDQQRHYLKLEEWRKKGRDFASITGDASAFLLDFGDFVAVEFSKTGNACFVFEKKVFLESVVSLHKRSFTVGELKNHNYFYRRTHIGPWQEELNYDLSLIGLRPVGRKL